MDFKVGDMVVLRDGLEVGKMYDGLRLLYHMSELIKTPREITHVDRQGDCRFEGLPYWYSQPMLQLYKYQPKEPTMPRFSFHKLDEGFAFGVWLYFKPFSMHITFYRWVFNFRVVK